MKIDRKNYTNETMDSQLRQMADEVQQAYDLTTQEAKSPSVDEAWQQFNAKYHVKEENNAPSLAPYRSFWKHFGVAACLLLVCVVAAAISFAKNEELGASLSEEVGVRSEEYKNTEEIEENETSIIYRNVALSQIVEQLAQAHNTSVNNLASADIRLYVELERSWSLQESIDFLNHFEHVNLVLTTDQMIEVR